MLQAEVPKQRLTREVLLLRETVTQSTDYDSLMESCLEDDTSGDDDALSNRTYTVTRNTRADSLASFYSDAAAEALYYTAEELSEASSAHGTAHHDVVNEDDRSGDDDETPTPSPSK